jgi:hypothetical protein
VLTEGTGREETEIEKRRQRRNKRQRKTRHTIQIEEKEKKEMNNEPTCRCQSNPLIGALGIQEPVIPGEPLIKG